MNNKISMVVVMLVMLVMLGFGMNLLSKADDIAENLNSLDSRQQRIEQLLNEGR